MKKSNNLTLTIVASMHANYGEGLGNISTVQKINFNHKQYAIRTKESLKRAIMEKSGLYDDLKTVVNGAAQKMINKDNTLEVSAALEGGYLTTEKNTYKRNSSFTVSDAISIVPFSVDTRFCNNLLLAQNYAMLNGYNVNDDAKKSGLMPYQYEVDDELKIYSISIDLEKIGVDRNFNINVDADEKIYRVNALLDAVKNLSLIVKGFLDNAEPLFVVGGLCNNKTNVFENVVMVKDNKISITSSLINKIKEYDAKVAFVEGIFDNDSEIRTELNAIDVNTFFNALKEDVKKYYEQGES